MNNSTHISDLCISGPFRVYAVNLGQYIYSYLDQDAPGEIPPDIAVLPVLSLRAVGSSADGNLSRSCIYIDTEV